MTNSFTSKQQQPNSTGPLYPNLALSLTEQPPVVLLAMCLFGEARGETQAARRAVAQVIVNRARHALPLFGSQRGSSFQDNIVKVLTKASQFSCMMPGDVNYLKMFDPLSHDSSTIWRDCLEIAGEFITFQTTADNLTHNSDHYFDDSIVPPSWADPAKETVKLGRLRFFRLYLPALQSGAGMDQSPNRAQASAAAPSLSHPSSPAVMTAGEAPQPSFPATPPPMIRPSQHGLTRWLGGRELSSLEASVQNGAAPPTTRG